MANTMPHTECKQYYLARRANRCLGSRRSVAVGEEVGQSWGASCHCVNNIGNGTIETVKRELPEFQICMTSIRCTHHADED